jgi:hypothetical protein
VVVQVYVTLRHTRYLSLYLVTFYEVPNCVLLFEYIIVVVLGCTSRRLGSEKTV